MVLDISESKTKYHKKIELKSLCTMKETTSKVKRQASEWGEIIANEAMDK